MTSLGSFEKLHREVRDDIYRAHLCSGKSDKIFLYSTADSNDHHHAILRTSRQIYDEAREILYKENTFSILISLDDDDWFPTHLCVDVVADFLKTIGLHNSAHLRKVAVIMAEGTTHEWRDVLQALLTELSVAMVFGSVSEPLACVIEHFRMSNIQQIELSVLNNGKCCDSIATHKEWANLAGGLELAMKLAKRLGAMESIRHNCDRYITLFRSFYCDIVKAANGGFFKENYDVETWLCNQFWLRTWLRSEPYEEEMYERAGAGEMPPCETNPDMRGHDNGLITGGDVKFILTRMNECHRSKEDFQMCRDPDCGREVPHPCPLVKSVSFVLGWKR